MKGSCSLPKQKEKYRWMAEHAEEIARAYDRGLSLSQVATKFDTSEYFVYVALYITGDVELPHSYVSSIKQKYGSLKSGFSRRRAPMHHKIRPHSHPAPNVRDAMLASAIEHTSEIFADHQSQRWTIRELAEKYGVTEYFIRGALYQCGKRGDSHDANFAKWPKPKKPVNLQMKEEVSKFIETLTPPDPKNFSANKEEHPDAVAIMLYETAQLKQARERTADYDKVKAERDQLKIDVEFWMKEAERGQSAAGYKKKYEELLDSVNANIAERVAADNVEAHKG